MPEVHIEKESKTGAVQSFWPDFTWRLFESLKEIPWVSLAAGSTVLGGSILFFYFRSIAFIPTDLSTLVGLGGAAALAALGLFVVLTLGLFASATIYQIHVAGQHGENPRSRKTANTWGLGFLQLGGIGWLLLLGAYFSYRQCDAVDSISLVAAGIFLPFFLAGSIGMIRESVGFARQLWSFYVSMIISLISVASFLTLFAFRDFFHLPGMNPVAMMLPVWLAIVAGNSFLATRLKWQGVAVASAILTTTLIFVASMASERKSFFPSLVATTLGVRSDGPRELMVPLETCELVRGALLRANTSSNLSCQDAHWNQVHAQILSNVGERWLIELSVGAFAEHADAKRVRLTIPGSGVQLVGVVKDEGKRGVREFCRRLR